MGRTARMTPVAGAPMIGKGASDAKACPPALCRRTRNASSRSGRADARLCPCILGDPGGLTQSGVHIERLPPRSTSSLRHWHETEDEFILMLSGEVILREEGGETPLTAGDAAAWPAGVPNGHCLENRSGADATCLTVGTRNRADVIHYPDHDRICHKDGSARRWTRGDGTAVAP